MESSPVKPGIRVLSRSAEETRRLGVCFGRHATPGTLILLSGELGSGKTVFVQGLARGLSVPEAYAVTSPTFSFVHEYPGRLPLAHVDLYRLGDPEELEEIGLEEILTGGSVVAVEWGERLPAERLPAPAFRVELETAPDDSRRIRISGPDPDRIQRILSEYEERP